MKLNLSKPLLTQCALAVIAALGTTFLMLAAGRDTLSETVIALLYLLPVGWVTARWGQLPGMCAALVSALMFDFFFIPPFFTFTVGSLDGWMALIIFTLVAVVLIGRIQAGLTLAQQREREATFLFELTARLTNASSLNEIAQMLAVKLQELYLASAIQVTFQLGQSQPATVITLPENSTATSKPDLTVAIQSTRDLLGDVRIWKGNIQLPPEGSQFLASFVRQAAFAAERLNQNGHLSR